MKSPTTVSIYETYSTDLSTALRAVGCDLINTDPIRRIFSEQRPCNPSVSHGLARGGQLQYRHDTQSTEFDATAGELAQAFTTPNHEYNVTTGRMERIPADRFDSMIQALREKLKGTEAGQDFETIVREYPKEIMRYLAAMAEHRRETMHTIRERRDIVELLLLKKDDGNYVLVSASMPQDQQEELINA